MKKNVYPNRENCSEDELEGYIRLAKTPLERCRLSAIKMLWRGMSAVDVADCLSVSDVSVYNWVIRFNLKGLDGLLNRYRGGRPRVVSEAQVCRHLNVFEEPEKAQQSHWSAKKFHGYLQEQLKKEFSYQTTLNYLHENGYALKYGRCWPDMPEGNEEKRSNFINEIRKQEGSADVKIWYMDEAGFDGDPRARRGWHKKGERKKIYRTQKHLRMNVSGMCCPKTGEFFALEFPYSDSRTFQCFLNNANIEIEQGEETKEIIVLDNASWHKVKSLNWGRFQPLFLPPYSPDLNPIERIWGYLKEHYFHSFSAKNIEQLIEQLDFALCSIWNSSSVVSSITRGKEN